MNNVLKQKQLDKQRWIKSEKAKQDLGGTFIYCNNCKHQSASIGTAYYTPTPHCNCAYEQRKVDNPCAVAYNRYYHTKNK